jgi:hypothetical protein
LQSLLGSWWRAIYKRTAHLFPKRDKDWTDKLDDQPAEILSASQPHPRNELDEELSPKLLEFIGGGDPD